MRQYFLDLLNEKHFNAENYVVFGQNIKFNEEQLKYINVKIFFNNIKARLQKEFVRIYKTQNAHDNKYENFIASLEILEKQVATLHKEITEFWKRSEIRLPSDTLKYSSSDPIDAVLSGDIMYTSCFRYIYASYSGTVLGQMQELTRELERAKKTASENALYRHNQKATPSSRWVGGGFGIGGAIKGAITAGVLNLAGSAAAGVRKGISDMGAASYDMQAIRKIESEIKSLYASDDELLNELGKIVDLYFDMTMASCGPFNYEKYQKCLKDVRDASPDFRKELIAEAIYNYPFHSLAYGYAQYYFPGQSKDINKIDSLFNKQGKSFHLEEKLYRKSAQEVKNKLSDSSAPVNTSKSLIDLLYMGWAWERDDIDKALEFYVDAYKLDPTNELVLTALKINGINVGNHQNIYTPEIYECLKVGHEAEREGNYLDALVIYNEIMKLDPDNKYADEKMEYLSPRGGARRSTPESTNPNPTKQTPPHTNNNTTTTPTATQDRGVVKNKSSSVPSVNTAIPSQTKNTYTLTVHREDQFFVINPDFKVYINGVHKGSISNGCTGTIEFKPGTYEIKFKMNAFLSTTVRVTMNQDRRINLSINRITGRMVARVY